MGKVNNKHNKYFENIESMIVNAFKNMFYSGNEESISIKSLCKQADVDRSTFYAHFKSLDELYKLVEDEIVAKQNSAIKNQDDFDKFLKNPDSIYKNDPVFSPDNIQRFSAIANSKIMVNVLDRTSQHIVDVGAQSPKYKKKYQKQIDQLYLKAFAMGIILNFNLYYRKGNKKKNMDSILKSNELVASRITY